jgi:hypothetical protein
MKERLLILLQRNPVIKFSPREWDLLYNSFTTLPLFSCFVIGKWRQWECRMDGVWPKVRVPDIDLTGEYVWLMKDLIDLIIAFSIVQYRNQGRSWC